MPEEFKCKPMAEPATAPWDDDDDDSLPDAMSEEFKCEPMAEPATAPWDVDISVADFKKLQVGHEPHDQDDRYWFAATGPDEAGVTSFHIVRCFPEQYLYVLHVRPGDDGGSFKVVSFTWQTNKCGIHITEAQAKKEAVVLCRMYLECEFEALPDWDSSIFGTYVGYQRHGSQGRM